MLLKTLQISTFADVLSACHSLSKVLRKAPNTIADEILESLKGLQWKDYAKSVQSTVSSIFQQTPIGCLNYCKKP